MSRKHAGCETQPLLPIRDHTRFAIAIVIEIGSARLSGDADLFRSGNPTRAKERAALSTVCVRVGASAGGLNTRKG